MIRRRTIPLNLAGIVVVTLVPFRDPWLSSHEGRVGRFVRKEHLARVCPGPALPAILVSGDVAGAWTLDPAASEVDLTWFKPPGARIEERAAAIARGIGDFARRSDLALEPLSVPTPEGPFVVDRQQPAPGAASVPGHAVKAGAIPTFV